MATLPDFKRGDTFILGCTYCDESNAPLSLEGIAIRSQVRKGMSKTQISELSVEVSDQATNPGYFVLRTDETRSWPTGKLSLDIEFRSGGNVSSSQTVDFMVVRDLTYD